MIPAEAEAGLAAEIAARCEADPGRERCGFVVARGGGLEVIDVPNVADALHAEDPVAHPRSSRDGFDMDPGVLLALQKELRAGGGRVAVVWHSHVEGGASLSAADLDGALVDGAPVMPGAEQWVLALRGGRVAEVRRYRFEGGEYRPLGPAPATR